jgi:hypothetical protein
MASKGYTKVRASNPTAQLARDGYASPKAEADAPCQQQEETDLAAGRQQASACGSEHVVDSVVSHTKLEFTSDMVSTACTGTPA